MLSFFPDKHAGELLDSLISTRDLQKIYDNRG